MNAWLLLLILAIGAFIAMLFREQQRQNQRQAQSGSPQPPPLPESYDQPPNSEDVPPPVPAAARRLPAAARPLPPLRFRRTVPPPLPTVVPAPVPVVTRAPEPVRRAPTVSANARPPSRAVSQLLELLRSPQTVRAAILLNEVLGPPRSRRPRH